MKKIKIVAAVITAVMVLSLAAAFAAENDGKITLTVASSADKVDVGDTVEISVSISEASDATAITFYLSYDPEAVELVGEANVPDEIKDLLFYTNSETPGVIMGTGMCMDVDSGITEGGVLFTAEFKVLYPNTTFTVSEVEEMYDSDLVNHSSEVATVDAKITCAHSTTETAVTKEPACETKGVKTTVCSVCGETVKTEEIPATGHKQGEWVVVTEPTCTETGLRETYCTVCGAKAADEEIPALGHKQGEWVVVTEATCTKAGLQKTTCTVCSEEYEEEIPAKGHSFSEWVVVTEATLEEEGKEERTCLVCGETETRAIEKLSAEVEEPDGTNNDNADDSEESGSTPTTGDIFLAGIVAAMLFAGAGGVLVWRKKKIL